MGCGDVCLLKDEGHRAIQGSSLPLLINLTMPHLMLPMFSKRPELAALGSWKNVRKNLAVRTRDGCIRVLNRALNPEIPASIKATV